MEEKANAGSNESDRGCNITPDRKESRLLLGLIRKKQDLGIKSEDKLDGVSNGNKRTRLLA